MPRLKALPKRLASAPRALGAAGRPDVASGKSRNSGLALRNLYATKRWRDPETGVRARIIARDGGQCRMCRVLLIGAHPAANSPVVDHIRPHNGNLLLFWDEGNLQALCKRCHDTEKQGQDALARAQGRGEGWG